MELNTIQTEGPWNEIAEALNDNFSKIDVAIKSGTGGGGGGTSIEDGSITTPKIANNAVTLDKVSKSIQESLYKADGAVQHHEVYDKGAIDGLLNDKVDKVSGKGLSTNDYTNEEKAQVERVRNGSVVTDNTLSELDETSNKPVSGKGIASAIEAASNSLKDREQLMNSNVKLIGKGNTLVKANFKGDVLEGHTIRVYVKYPNVDYTGVSYTSSSFDRFVISFRDASGALISAPVWLTCNTFEALASYYDLDVPTGTSYLIVTMRAANGFVQILTVEDITEINRLDNAVSAIETSFTAELKGKQNTITDLETIREGAEKGATAAQPEDIPTKLSQLTDDVVKDNYLPVSKKFHTGSLNDYKTAGIYRFNVISDASSEMTHYGNLLVVRGGDNDTLTQLYFNYNNSRAFIRSSNLGGLPSAKWNRVAFTTDIPTKLSQLTDDIVSDAVTAEVDDRMRNYMTRDELKLNYVYRNKDDIQETLGISDWALASENPSYTKAEMDTKLGLKQNTLVSSSTIKTINGESILGSGNIQINSDGTTSIVAVVLDVSKLTVGSNFKITQEQFDNIKASRFGRTVVIKESQYSDSEWGQVLSCYRVYVGSSVYAVRVSILHKDGGAFSADADNAKLYNIDIMDYQSASSYDCQVTSINNLS